MIDGVQFALDLFESEKLDRVELTFSAQAILAARGVPVSALAVAGAALEFLEMHDFRTMIRSFLEAKGK